MVLVLLYLIYNAVLLPIYNSLTSDVLTLESYLPGLVDISLELCQFLVWVHIFSFVISTFFTYGRKESLHALTWVSIVIIARYFVLLAVNVTNGNIAVNGSDFSFYIWEMIIYAFLDILQASLPYILLSLSKKEDIKKLYLSLGASAAVIALIKIVMRVINNVFEYVTFGYSFTALYIAYYASDILYGLMVYFLSLILIKFYLRKKTTV
ncbi:MAG: hypothetical protein E7623_01735 [Ruminococcaceae bacterium]|nr:hypothetical protein [Oscillospiraceae bacterium]